MISEIDTEHKVASIEGIIESISDSDYGQTDINIEDGSSTCGTSLINWIYRLPFVRKDSKIVVTVMVVPELPEGKK